MKNKDLIAAFICVSVITNGCSSNVNLNDDNKDCELSYIGEKHNEVLDSFFNHVRVTRSGSAEVDLKDEFKRAFPDASNMEIVSVNAEEKSLIDVIAEHDVVADTAEPFLREIDDMLLAPPDTMEELEKNIACIAQRAKETLTGDAAVQVYAYIDTATASLHYWVKNLDSLSVEFLGKTADTTDVRTAFDAEKIKAWWHKNKKRIAMCIASDAAGAAVGAISGGSAGAAAAFATAAAMPAVAGSAAAVGAVVIGSASSIQGFITEKFVVVFPDFVKIGKNK